MASIRELLKSGSGKESTTDASADREFLVQGISDDVELRIYVESQPLDEFIGLIGRSYDIDWIANDMAIIKVPYDNTTPTKNDRDRPTGTSKLSINSSAATQNVKTSLETIASFKTPLDVTAATPPDNDNAVNVTSSGSERTVEGVDIFVKAFSFTFTEYRANADTDEAYILSLYAIETTTNDDEWTVTDSGGLSMTFPEGEVLYLGFSCSQRNDDDYEIVHNFIASPNVEGMTLGSITGIDKKGWEYLWAEFRDIFADDDVNKAPYFAYVERMYEAGDFSIIGA